MYPQNLDGRYMVPVEVNGVKHNLLLKPSKYKKFLESVADLEIPEGTKVRFTKDIHQEANDHTPAWTIAFKGEETTVVKKTTNFWNVYVVAKRCNNDPIGVNFDEIEVIVDAAN